MRHTLITLRARRDRELCPVCWPVERGSREYCLSCDARAVCGVQFRLIGVKRAVQRSEERLNYSVELAPVMCRVHSLLEVRKQQPVGVELAAPR